MGSHDHRGIGEYPPRDSTPRPPSDWDQPSDFVPRYSRSRGISFDVRKLARGAGLYVGVALLIGGAAWSVYALSSKKPSLDTTADAFAPIYPAGFDQSRSVTLCDLNMQSQVVSPTSYRSDWRWEIAERAGVVAIKRGFTAKNRMGVKLRSEYTCLIDGETNRLVGLQFNDGERRVIINARDLDR